MVSIDARIIGQWTVRSPWGDNVQLKLWRERWKLMENREIKLLSLSVLALTTLEKMIETDCNPL